MKPFIVFMGLLIVSLSFLLYQGDMGRYERAQADLKSAAEELAADGALYYEERAFADGKLVIKEGESVAHQQYLLKERETRLGLSSRDRISDRVLMFDDSGMMRCYSEGVLTERRSVVFPYEYIDEAGFHIQVKKPSVVVTLRVDTADFFRLPFLTVHRIVRSAMYELSEGQIEEGELREKG